VIAEENLASGRVMRLQASMVPIRHLSLALLTGGLLTLAFPGWEISVLAWVALAPLMLAAGRERGAARAFGLGWVGGTLFFYASSWWLTYSPIHYADFSPLLAYALLLGPTLLCGAFVGLFALVVNVSVRRFGPNAMLAAPLVWVATEWLRYELTGIGWNFIGYSQAFQPALIQCASIGGVYAVSLLLAASSAALAYSALAPSRRAAWRVLAVTLALIVVNIAYGAVVLRSTDTSSGGLAVVALQPNLPVTMATDPDSVGGSQAAYDLAIGTLSRLGTEELGRDNAPPVPAPALVVWPEIPASYSYDDEPAFQSDLAAFATRRGDYLIVNALGDSGDGHHTNSAMLIGPDGRRVSEYAKMRLLPFGEYVPMRSIIPFIDRVPALLYDFAPGHEVRLLDADGARIGIAICFESAFPDVARDERRSGATGFVNMSNDAWFGPTPFPRQSLAHAVMRSVENRTEQLRVTNAGYSARIDSAGRIVDSTDLFVAASRRWSLRVGPPGPESLFTRFGDWLAIACALATIALVVAPLVRRRRAVIEIE
jgi:apolipoprotein N-acyltransferase